MQVVLFALVAILFVAGCGFIFVGMKRDPERLPSNADDVLDAIVSGRLAPPPRKSVDDTGEVRLVKRVERPAKPPTERRDPRGLLAEQQSDDDLTDGARQFFAQEPQLEKF